MTLIFYISIVLIMFILFIAINNYINKNYSKNLLLFIFFKKLLIILNYQYHFNYFKINNFFKYFCIFLSNFISLKYNFYIKKFYKNNRLSNRLNNKFLLNKLFLTNTYTVLSNFFKKIIIKNYYKRFCSSQPINFSIKFNKVKNLIFLKNNCFSLPRKKYKKNLKFLIKKIPFKKNLFLKKKYFYFLNKFLLNFFQFIFNLKIHLSFKKLWKIIKNVQIKKKHNFIISQIKKYTRKIRSFRFINNFYKILWLSLKLKDSSFFLKWFVYRMELFYYKLHRYIPYLFDVIFTRFSKLLYKQTNSKGVFFSLRGKISVTGDSKKRHSDIKSGKHSSSSKNLNISLNKSYVRTRTGVMGVTFAIFFN